MTLTDPTTYTGATAVSGGTLTIDSNLTSSPITVNPGGTVAGNGTVGSLTNAGGTVESGLHFLTTTSLSLVPPGETVYVGEQVTFDVSVTPLASLAGAATGTVNLMEGQTVLATSTLDSSGNAIFNNVTFSEAQTPSTSLSAVYVPTGNFVASSISLTQAVSLYAVNGKLTSSDSADVYGESLTLTATLTPTSDQSPVPTGSVKFYDGTTALNNGNSVSLSNGTATLVVTTPGTGESHAVVYLLWRLQLLRHQSHGHRRPDPGAKRERGWHDVDAGDFAGLDDLRPERDAHGHGDRECPARARRPAPSTSSIPRPTPT